MLICLLGEVMISITIKTKFFMFIGVQKKKMWEQSKFRDYLNKNFERAKEYKK